MKLRWLKISLAAFVALVALGAGLWFGGLRYQLTAKRWGEVEPGLYRSGQISSRLIRPMLEDHKIQLVVDLIGTDPNNADQPAERRAIADLGIELQECPLIGDGTGDIEQYAKALEAIVSARNAGKAVLVHCHAGSQRTGGVVACYEMLFRGKSGQEAYTDLVRFGWRPGRDDILLAYVNQHMPRLTADLHASGTLAKIPDPLPRLGP